MVTMRKRRRRPVLHLPEGAARAARVEVDVTPTPPKPERVPRPQRAVVDFDEVSDEHWPIHRRLRDNWARWSDGSQKQTGQAASPMFNLYRSSDARREYGAETVVPIDREDAMRLHFAIIRPDFDPQARRALQWAYLRPRNPAGAAVSIGVTLQGLAALVVAGRALLVERGV